MISPLPNNNKGFPMEVPPTNDNNIRCKTLPPCNVVSFGPLYDDLQQTEHFEREYQYLILQSIPPLIHYQQPMPSRVGVIPSSIKRSPLIPATHETTTLTHNFEPNVPTKENNVSVFSGPHFLPEKYSIKPITTFRQSYFVPTYKEDTPSRYYAEPHFQQYFRAALQDGSYFETYSDYKADDPVNFRHAYNTSQPFNSLDSHEKEKSTHSEPTTKSNLDSNRYSHPNQPSHRPVHRNTYRPIPSRPVLLTRPESIRQPQFRSDPQPSTSTRPTYSRPSSFDHIPYESSRPESSRPESSRPELSRPESSRPESSRPESSRPESSRPESSHTESSSDVTAYEEPIVPPARKWHKPVSISSDCTSEDESDTSVTITNRNKGKQPERAEFTPKRKVATYSPSPDAKKRKTSSVIPTKKEAIEELRQLGQFTKLWKQKDAEVCCVCFEDVTTQNNPLVYCDNALCEVIVHKNCYKIKSNIANSENWYCDRCRTDDEDVSVYRNVACVLCPNITGAFCKLSEPFYGIEWVHMICAKNFTGPTGFTYQAKTHDYRLSIRFHIPIQRFLDSCMYCTDPMFAQFGAKLKCRFCDKLFHVTCAGKHGYWCFNKDAILACADHAIPTTTKSSPKRLALAFEKWISKRDMYLFDEFNISPTDYQIETWKKTVKNAPSITENDVMDQSFKHFFDQINCHNLDNDKKKYTKFVDFLLDEFCRNYSASYILSVNGLFLKKNFYHSAEYGYVPPKGSFSGCKDAESLKKKAEKTSGNEATPKIILYTTPPKTSAASTNNKKTNISNDARVTANNQPTTSTAATTSTTATATPPSKTRRSEEQPIVVPSPDLICFICGQHDFPKVTWDSFAFGEDYVEHLEATSHQRKLGHTGTGNFWDPRVFIQCAECHLKVHCGCPNPPIKKYPQKFQSFVCIHCDTKGEEVSLKNDFNRRRGTTGINYKV